METDHKKQIYIKLEKKMKNNESLISVYKKATPICMALFVLTAFFSFYFSINENDYVFLSKSLLVLLFAALALFYFSINKKEKENKKIITKLYN